MAKVKGLWIELKWMFSLSILTTDPTFCPGIIPYPYRKITAMPMMLSMEIGTSNNKTLEYIRCLILFFFFVVVVFTWVRVTQWGDSAHTSHASYIT